MAGVWSRPSKSAGNLSKKVSLPGLNAIVIRHGKPKIQIQRSSPTDGECALPVRAGLIRYARNVPMSISFAPGGRARM